MKKLIFGLAFLGSLAFSSYNANAQGMGGGGSGGECMVEVIICNWIHGTMRQICHQNGNGVTCNCGDSTNCG